MDENNTDAYFAHIRKTGGIPIRRKEDIPETLRIPCCDPIDSEWQAFIDNQPWGSGYTGVNTLPDNHKDLIHLLKSFGGHEVCIPRGYEEDCEEILSRGQLWPSERLILMKGEDSRCHSNASLLWEANKDRTLEGPYRQKVTIATGYALTPDGMWRQHSWVLLRQPRLVKVVETTVPRIAYFGYAMTDVEAELFAAQNI